MISATRNKMAAAAVVVASLFGASVQVTASTPAETVNQQASAEEPAQQASQVNRRDIVTPVFIEKCRMADTRIASQRGREWYIDWVTDPSLRTIAISTLGCPDINNNPAGREPRGALVNITVVNKHWRRGFVEVWDGTRLDGATGSVLNIEAGGTRSNLTPVKFGRPSPILVPSSRQTEFSITTNIGQPTRDNLHFIVDVTMVYVSAD